LTVVFEGLNISELRLITGPAGAELAFNGEVAGISACALQPASVPTVINTEAAPIMSRRRTD
jgi:hypothetical protein